MEAKNGYRPLAGDDHEAAAAVIRATGAGFERDDVKLRLLGYKQQLKRDLSVVANFSVSFSIISVITGVTTLYGTGLQFGGPVTMVYGWPIAGAFTVAVGLAMAEICSAYPTSGGLYFWSARLCTHRRWGPFAAWLTGWFNVVGQWAVTTSVDYSLAQLIQVIILLATGGKNGGGYLASKYMVIAFHAAILLSHAVINSLPITVLSFFGQFAAAWNMLGVFVLMIAVPTVATERASAEFVFTHFNTDNGAGIRSNLYIFVLGLLMSQYTLTGYDASAHMRPRTELPSPQRPSPASLPPPRQMEDSYRESIWRKKGRPKEMYPDVSCKDAPVPPEEPIPNCDCGHLAHVGQSRHPDTAARCFYTCYSCSPYFRCFFFQWIDGPDKFDPRILLFYPGIDHCKREVFTRWVPPPPNPPPMTDEEKAVASARRLENPPKCLCGEQAVINPRNEQEFICPLRHEDHDFPKCRFKEWIYGPKSHWPEPEKNVEVPDWKKKRRSIAPPVMCKCGVEASYGLVPSGLGIGHFCGHMIDYDESTRKCKWESYDDVYNFKKEYKTMVAVRNSRGYPASYVTDFVKSHKKKMLRRAQDLRVRNPESIAWKKWYEQKKKDVEEYQARKVEEDARKAAEEAAREQMQGLNDTIDSLCAKIGCTGGWEADMARARYTENRTVKRHAGVGATASRPIVVDEQAEPEEDDDTGRIGELIRLAEELGYPQDEDAYDMGRIAELLRLAEELGPMPEEEVAVEEGQAAYQSHKTPLFDAWGPTDMTQEEAELYSQAADEAEAAYYRRQASQAKAVEATKGKEVVVEDSESEDELLTQWCTQFD